MTQVYQPERLPDGSPNPKFKTRARLLPDGSPNPRWRERKNKTSGPSGRKKSAWSGRYFVAWDGEGITLTGGAALRVMLDDLRESATLDTYDRAMLDYQREPESSGWYRFTADGTGWWDRELIASALTDLQYYVATLGRGRLTDTVIERVTTASGKLLAAYVLDSDPELTADDAQFLVGCVDPQTAPATIDDVRDQRERGRLVRPRRRSVGAAGRSLAGEEAYQRLLEIQPRRASSGKKQIPLPLPVFSPAPPPIDPQPLRRHLYTLLAAGWYDNKERFQTRELGDGQRRLTTKEILAFIFEVRREVPSHAIHVAFSAVYDFTHILYDVAPDQAWNGLSDLPDVRGFYGRYAFKVRPRRSLDVWLLDKGKKRLFWRCWDVFGFFQSSFAVAARKWLGDDYPDLPLIEAGKLGRGQFDTWEPDEVTRYNQAELKALVLVMRKLRDALGSFGLKLSRWDGAGAVASAALRANLPDAKGWYADARAASERLGPELDEALKTAFFGGRIEMLQFGTYRGTLHHADINSAYPSALVTLPDLSRGEWHRAGASLPRFGVVRCRWVWSLPDDRLKVGPLPVRFPDGSILFPLAGEGWYYTVEVEAAQRYGARLNQTIEILDSWEFTPTDPSAKPFLWVHGLYETRRALRQSKDPLADGQQYVIKLAINSLYGKSAQQLGYRPVSGEVTNPVSGRVYQWRDDVRTVPPYYHLAIAGYVTAYCRARLLDAIDQPEHVICFMTDGLYATQPLNVTHSPDKALGEWDVEVIDDAVFVIVQPGVYYLSVAGVWSEASRGFSFAAQPGMDHDTRQRAIAGRVNSIWDQWHTYYAGRTARGELVAKLHRAGSHKDIRRDIFHYARCLYLPVERLVSIRAALQGRWSERGQWVMAVSPEGRKGRALMLIDPSTKRTSVEPADHIPDPRAELVWTEPNYAPSLSESMLADSHIPVSCPYRAIPYDLSAYPDLEDEPDMILRYVDF